MAGNAESSSFCQSKGDLRRPYGALLSSNIVPGFRYPGSNFMNFLLIYLCMHKGIHRIVLDELQRAARKGQDNNTGSNGIFHKRGRNREFLELLHCFLAACDKQFFCIELFWHN
jgi:hypothetical protein